MAQPMKEPSPQPSSEPAGLRKWGSLLVLSLTLAIIIIDTTLLNVSLKPRFRLPPAARSEMTAARRVATERGNRKALLYGAGFILLGLLVSTRLPLRAKEHGKGGEDQKGDH
jgi:hypothetical protein